MSDFWLDFMVKTFVTAMILAPFCVWRYKEDQIEQLRRDHQYEIQKLLESDFEECDDLELFSRN